MFFISVIIGIGFFILYIIDIKIGYKIPVIVKTISLSFLFISAVLGSVVDLYDYIPLYDKITHFLSGIAVSWLFIIWVLRKNKDYNVCILRIMCFNAAIAAFWEVGEYLVDLVFNTNFQKGLTDTMLDMIMAIIGGLLITLIYKWKRKNNICLSLFRLN
ncbi:MAG: DUF2238 domain-containing protein [Bacilli bacterium]|nr:DUF2238 domain-containing protein [Bacilli bacterium]MDD4298152.1 DUF2238 domain-containing protein [Bacilli bacterium]MDD4644137.1 DUF2238 domain-containing protein [Bacilli bacterium]